MIVLSRHVLQIIEEAGIASQAITGDTIVVAGLGLLTETQSKALKLSTNISRLAFRPQPRMTWSLTNLCGILYLSRICCAGRVTSEGTRQGYDSKDSKDSKDSC